MPIRFRCAYCNQLMGIARRKAGTVVNCPKCAGQVIVPHPEPEDGPANSEQEAEGPAQPQNIFENSEIDVILGPAPAPQSNSGMPAAPAADAGNLPVADIVSQYPSSEIDPLQSMAPWQQPANGLYLTRAKLTILSVIMALLLGLAFFLGMLVGGGT